MDKWAEAGFEITELTPEAAAEFAEASAPVYDEFADELTPLKISNGKWMWWSQRIGGYKALDYLVTVSYTHLDVYKRQPPW